ncbi:MAG: carbohydrate-binding protein [Bacteroidetes bacterium]|nr:carbohydrate-binding protein [Bacteroidota bacterium]
MHYCKSKTITIISCIFLGTLSLTGLNAQHTHHVAVSGEDSYGAKAYRSISAAAQKALPGDTIMVHEGVYREWINPPRGGSSEDMRIVYMAASGETVVIKGSEQVRGWKKVEQDTWELKLPNTFFGNFNPYSDLLQGNWYSAKGPYHTGAVYLNGHWLKEAARKDLVLKSESDGEAVDDISELMNLREITPGDKSGSSRKASGFLRASKGLETMNLRDGLSCVGRLQDGATLSYSIDFGEESMYMFIQAASPVEGGLVDIHMGDADGELLGTFDVGFTTEWTSFQPFHANLARPLSGSQDITLVFRSRPREKKTAGPQPSYWFAEVEGDSTIIWADFKKYAKEKAKLSKLLMQVLENTNDPRLTDAFDFPPYIQARGK